MYLSDASLHGRLKHTKYIVPGIHIYILRVVSVACRGGAPFELGEIGAVRETLKPETRALGTTISTIYIYIYILYLHWSADRQGAHFRGEEKKKTHFLTDVGEGFLPQPLLLRNYSCTAAPNIVDPIFGSYNIVRTTPTIGRGQPCRTAICRNLFSILIGCLRLTKFCSVGKHVLL